jgi:predicted DNA-binding mobile mystery protein A
MKRSQRSSQARRELDRKFAGAKLTTIQTRPRSGWIRAIRTGLGMSQHALATRLGIAAPSLAGLESSERHDTISIGKLAEVARAMDCTLVYAFVPNTTLEDTVQQQARRVATETLGYVANTMQLEDQAVEEDWHTDQLDRLAQDVIESNRLWKTQ